METINKLKENAKSILDSAKTKEEIDTATKLMNSIEAVEKESSGLVAKNAELVNAYRELIKGQSFAPSSQETGRKEALSFDDALKEIKKAHKEK